MQRETGKVWAEASSEVPYVTDLINFYSKKARPATSATSGCRPTRR